MTSRSEWRTERQRAAALIFAMFTLGAPAGESQQPVQQPAPVDTQRLDSLRRMFRTSPDSSRRFFRSDTSRLATATPVSRTSVRPVTPVRPVGRADSLRQRSIGTDGVYDVVLDVPNVSVEEIVLQVDGVRAHVSLDARVAKLVQLSVGADVGIERVHLGIRGVQAEAHLRVDLDNVATIVDRVLTTIDRNPQIIAGLLQTLETTVATVGSVANTALQPGGVVSGLVGAVGQTLQNVTGQGGLLSAQGINALGQTVLRTVDATGRIVERTVDQAGGIVGENVVGSVLQLPLLGQGRGPGGQLVRTVQDVSGALIGVTMDATGKILATDVLRGANRMVGEAAGDVDLDLLQQLVLSSSLTREGRTVQRIVELTGSIVERVVEPATGKVLSRKELGNALTLPLVREQMDPTGSLLRVVRDASGALIEMTLSPNGTLSRLRLLQLNSPTPSTGGVDGAIRGLAGGISEWLIGQVVDSSGGTVQRMVDISGRLLARTVDATGRVVRQESFGNVLQLAPVSETRRQDGRVVRVVRDSLGSLLEVILGAQGQLELVRAVADPSASVPNR